MRQADSGHAGTPMAPAPAAYTLWQHFLRSGLVEPALARSRPLPWFRTDRFWDDERFAPHDHPLSHYRMVREAMLALAPVPTVGIHSYRRRQPRNCGVHSRARTKILLRREPSRSGPPLFDVTLPRVAADGYADSLFAGAAPLDWRDRWVAAANTHRHE